MSNYPPYPGAPQGMPQPYFPHDTSGYPPMNYYQPMPMPMPTPQQNPMNVYPNSSEVHENIVPTQRSGVYRSNAVSSGDASVVQAGYVSSSSYSTSRTVGPVSAKEIYEKPFHLSSSLEESVVWFRKLCQDLRRQNVYYEDPHFPATDSSLFFSADSSRRARYVWKRPPELCRNPQFESNGISRFDVRQGELGDCWLLAAVSSLSLYQELFKHVVPSGQSFSDNYCGAFLFRFWQFGDWVDVVVDDRLPTVNGKLVYMHSTDTTEFWSALLEKAYAKLNGCYECLKGGLTSEAMEDFTGGITEMFEIGLGKQVPRDLWEIMRRANQRMSLMGCSIDTEDESELESKGPYGLLKGHAYAVTAIATVNKRNGVVNLCRVRNPWGDESEWIGPWSDRSREWREINEQERKSLGLTFEDDGEFWMSFDDFCRYFTKLEICHLSPESSTPDLSIGKKRRWALCREEGEWKRNVSAGGCRNFLSTFHMNPQFRVTVVDADDDDNENMGTLIVGLMQKGMRQKRREGKDMLTIGYIIYRLEGKCPSGLLDSNFFRCHASVAKSPAFINLREVCGRHRLPPGEYVVIPSTYNPNEDAKFLLRLFSEKKYQSSELDERTTVNDPPVVETTEEMSPSDEAKLRRAFLTVAGADMEIDAYELRDILNHTFRGEFNFEGFGIETARSLLAHLDIDKSGKLGFEEFRSLWMNLRLWKTVFKRFDLDRSGNLNSYELRTVFGALGITVSRKLFDSIVTRYANKDGHIQFDDFNLLVVRLKTIFQSYKSQEKTSNGRAAVYPLDDLLSTTLYL